MRINFFNACLFLIVLFSGIIKTYGISSDSVANKKKIYVFEINKEIAPPMLRVTQKAMDDAQRVQPDYILIRMNTYGGMVNVADSIRTRILNSEIPVWVFIDNNAASAGALISIAADSIYMRSGGNIGAATVVNQSGEVVPDKFQSYMRSTMRSTAESHGKDTIIQGNDTIIKWHRDPLIAEAMVDPRTYIEGIIDTGKVLTFTTQEAIKYGYCEGDAENIEQVMEKAGIKEYEIVRYTQTSIDKIIGFLISPVIQGILIMLIIGGIYFELQSPGVGFPLAAAIFGAVLYFAPLYLEGLAENWELLIFIIGILLLALEIFVIPGFGVAGVAGIVLMITGLTISMVDNVTFKLDKMFAINQLVKAMFVVVTSSFIALLLSIYLGKKLLTSTAFGHLALRAVQDTSSGYISADLNQKKLIGKEGIAVTVLRPSGKVEIEDEIYDALAEIGYIDKGEKVKVTRDEAGQIFVIKVG